MSRLSPPAALAILFSRLLIPGWLLTGALFKLYYLSPKHLPKTVWRSAFDMGVDLDVLLRSIIALEIVLAGIMFFTSRLSRLTAIVVMGVFCAILLIEIAAGAETCGCLGKVSMPPWLMLVIDLPLLAGAVIFRPGPKPTKAAAAGMSPWPAVLALALVLVSVGSAFMVPAKAPPAPPPPGNGDEVEPRPVREPWYVASADSWAGKHWDELDITIYLDRQPKDVNVGRRYVIFYGRTCDHCYETITLHFRGALPAPTTVIAIPEYKDRFEEEGVYEMRCTECEQLRLALGTDYLIEPPLVIALEDGIVQCAFEGEESDGPQCLIWH